SAYASRGGATYTTFLCSLLTLWLGTFYTLRLQSFSSLRLWALGTLWLLLYIFSAWCSCFTSTCCIFSCIRVVALYWRTFYCSRAAFPSVVVRITSLYCSA